MSAIDPPVLRQKILPWRRMDYLGVINCFHLVDKVRTAVQFPPKPKPADDLSQLI